jgi:CHAT domain-containing protein
MKARLSFLVCLIICWQLPVGVWANAETDRTIQRANELLARAKEESDNAVAAKTVKQALALFQTVNHVEGIAEAHMDLGGRYFAQNMWTDATQHYEAAFQSWRQKSNLKMQAEALIMLGYIEARNGEWMKAVSYLTQAHNLIDEQSYFEQLGQIAAGLAYTFTENGLPEKAITQHQRAMEYYGRAGPSAIPYYHRQIMLLGKAHFLLKNYPAALTYVQQALNHFESLSDQRSQLSAGECREYLGQIYFALGQYDVALQYLKPLASLYTESGNNGDAAHAKALTGQVYEQLGDRKRARANYLEAAQIFSGPALNDRVRTAAVRFALGRLELNENNYDAAESYLRESIKTTEDIRSDLKSRMLAEAFSASVHERYEAYIDCLMRQHSQNPTQGFAARAFEASELARARSLAELLRDTQTKDVSGVDPQLLAQERTLRQAIRSKAEQSITLLAGDPKKEQVDELASSLTSLREQHIDVVLELKRQNPNFDQIKEPATYSLKQIQEQIIEDDETTLLEYFVGKNASYVWVVTRNDIKVFNLPKAEEITNAVSEVYKLLETPPGSDTEQHLKKATAKLVEMIIEPLRDQLKARRIIVVADGALTYIPFQLLPGMANSQTPLVENYEIVNAPSASILGQLRHEKQQRRPRTMILAAFGDPVFPDNYAQFKGSGAAVASAKERGIELQGDTVDPAKIQSLFYSKFELNDLRQIAGSSSFIARGFDASRANFENTDFSQFAILHIATHAGLNIVDSEKSGFYLSMVDRDGQPQPGFISTQDVYSLQVPVDVLVASACRTGLGKDVRGEGLIGLTRAFMHAGASTVVASLWKVDDEATALLMKHFYENMLKKGMRPAEALRAAQNTLRQDPTWQAPHYWAGFTLQGEFREPLRLPPPAAVASRAVQNAVGGGLMLTLLLGIGWGFWRRRI